MLKLKIALVAGTGLALAGMAHGAEYLGKSAFQQMRAYSPAVLSRGGTTIWLAGQTTTVDLTGKSLVGNFEGQARADFALIDRTLKRIGGSLRNLVTMTVFINDPRYGDEFVKLRHEMFPDGKFPASALITVSNFAQPGILIEIQGVAVIGE